MSQNPSTPTMDAALPRLTLDAAGYITGWNPAAEDFFGFTEQEALGQHLLFLGQDGDSPLVELEQLSSLDRSGQPLQLQVERRTRQGLLTQAQLTLHTRRDEAGHVQALEAVYRPVSRAVPSEPDRLNLFASVIEHSTQAVMVTDAEERIVIVNEAFTRITGYNAQEAIGQTADLLCRGKRRDVDFRLLIRHTMQGAGLWLGEVMGRRKSGEVYPQSVCISATRSGDGEATHAFTIFSDITGHKDAEARLQRLANFDSVTGLPNRLLLGELLGHNLRQAKRSKDTGGVLVVQLQRLGWIYDTLGHEAGDAFMAQTAQRLKDALREQDVLARLGHDKLAIVLPKIPKREHAALVAQKLLAVLQQPFTIDGHTIHCPASVGIAVYPDNGMESAGLLRNAEVANSRGLEQGDSGPTFFSDDMNLRANERFRIESELRHALSHGELLLYHQPKVSLRNGRIVGAEALLRWQHPRHGLMAPGNFVPVAEETSLILDLGNWVLQEACRQLSDWRQRGLRMPPLAVNLSARQFDKGLPQRIDELLQTWQIPARMLKLEITESLMVRGADEVVPIMNELVAMGLGIALDDFGTGYSSLAYLKKFPLTTLKIDRAFVVGIPDQPNDCAIAQAIVTMGQQLRQEIVAEGVESLAQMEFLRSLGCDQLQGYLFSPPVPAQAYERMVQDDVRLPAGS